MVKKMLLVAISLFSICVGMAGSVSAADADENMQSNLNCDGPQFTADQIKQIVQRERSVRNDLPPEPENYTSTVRRQRCHYVYIETPDDAGAHDETVFILDSFGVIVDFAIGRGNPDASIECPKRKLSDEEIQNAVNLERKRYSDLPAQPSEFTTSVTPRRCMFVYSESTGSNDADGKKTLSFTVDQYGSVYSAYTQ